jgi:hypothetical protein
VGDGRLENETDCAYHVAPGEYESVHGEDAEVGSAQLGWTLAAVQRLYRQEV